MKHTPAPWHINPTNDSRTKYRIYANPQGLSLICNAEGAMPTETNEANARLIAAAPELLAALECLTFTVDGLVSDKGQIVKDALNIARAAIAKAKGE